LVTGRRAALLVSAVVLLGILATTLLIGGPGRLTGQPASTLSHSVSGLSPGPLIVSTSRPRPISFVGRAGRNLILNGRPFRFTGLNIYNANSLWTCAYPLGAGPDLAASLAAIGPGQSVFRSFFFQRMATTKGQRDWSAFDHTLAVARAHGEYVIATLTNQWGACEEPVPGYKTESWYQSGYRTRLDATVPSGYRDWVREVVTRYRNDPTIMAWQLVNEAEDGGAPGGPCSPTASASLKAFATDVSQLIKSLDPNHLVSLGTIGSGQCGTVGNAYQDVHSIASIDLCEVHDYGAPTSSIPGDQWNGMQVRINQCRALNKPLFVGETGIEAAAVGGDARRAKLFADKFAAQFGAGIVGELIWDYLPGPDAGSKLDTYYVGPGDPVLSLFASYTQS
jgi:mannan endo-1,4-beta-mannosidase